jgi:acetyl esterase/lipase
MTNSRPANPGAAAPGAADPGAVIARYEGKRKLYPALRRPPNPPLNTGYIRHKWLDVPYAVGSERALMDIYLPNHGTGPYPVILFAHGGGYFTGDKGDYETYPPLEGLKRGYAVCAINYTLSGEGLFPRQIQEGKAAIRFIRANAARYNLDTSCLIAWGMSAGANLVSMLATTGHTSFPALEDDSMGHADQPCHVDACMIWFCPTDFGASARLIREGGLEPHQESAGDDYVISWYFGLPVEQAPDLVALSNPETYITPEAPPFVIQHGKMDRVVPWMQSAHLAEKLAAAIGEDKVRLTLFDDYLHADRRFETMHNCSLVLDQLEELLGRG